MAKARKLIIAGNWKMNKTASEARELTKDIILELKGLTEADVVLCPPFTALAAVSEMISEVPEIALGAQNLHEKENGAFTGEISGGMLRDLFCRYVIIGHSERRQYFKESNVLISSKVAAALACKLKPIVCVGEVLQDREADAWKPVLETQLREGLVGLDEKQMAEITIAYEPVWAIGTGKTATPDIAQTTQAYAREILKDMFGDSVAARTRIQYGGSVKPENAADLLQQPDIDGALVGGASLDARSFMGIIKNACSK